MRNELIRSLKEHQAAFGLDLTDGVMQRLSDYYDLIREHNPLLHLVGPCSPEEFAIRHLLESLVLLEHLPNGVKFADVGAGAGLPSIPCLLAREDLCAVLIESKLKKAKFLVSAIAELGLSARAKLSDRQFEETDPSDCGFVACRALDKFTEKLPRLLKWSKNKKVLFYGGENLKLALQSQEVDFRQQLTPLSEQRYLFVIGP